MEEEEEGRRRRRLSPPPPLDGGEEGPARKRARRPAFDPALLASPFYRGRTAYGGAAAAAAACDRRPAPMSFERPRVTPAAARRDSSAISETTRRICELLAHCSTPVADAKRAPAAAAAASSSSTSMAASLVSTAAASTAPRRLRELRTPTMASLLALKRNNRKVGNAQAAIAASLSSSLPFAPEDYALRTDDRSQHHRPKMRTKLNGRRGGAEAADEAPPEPVRLPDAKLDMGGKRLPEFAFVPTPPPSLSQPVKAFTFRSPLDASDPRAEERLRFIDMSGAVKPTKRHASVGTAPTSLWNGSAAPSDDDRPPAKRPPVAAIVEKPPKPVEGFADILAKQKAQWECDSCLSRNDGGKLACVCCEAPKPGAEKKPPAPEKPPVAPPVVTGPSSLAGFALKQKEQWECDCCLARNDSNRQKCVCCEAAKPGSAPAPAAPKFNFGSPANSSFKFGLDKVEPVAKKEEVKATKEPDASDKPPAFTFGIPPKADDGAKPSGITFGIPNGSVSTGATKQEPPKTFTFGSPKTDIPKSDAPPTFTFGFAPKETPKPMEKISEPAKAPAATAFTFLSNQNVPKSEVKPLEEIKNTVGDSITPISVKESNNNEPIPETKAAIASPPNVVGEKPSLFNFGSAADAKPQFGFAAGSSTFNFPAVSTSASKPPAFGSPTASAEMFKFSAQPTDPTKPLSDSVPKFSSPLSNLASPKVGFSVPATSSILTVSSSATTSIKDSPISKPAGLQFPSPASEKKDQPAPPPVFSFGSSAAPSSVFTFGASSASKPETNNVNFNSQPNIFNSQPITEIGKNSSGNNNLFKTDLAASATGSFPPPNANIFGSKAPTVNPVSSNLFGSNAAGQEKKPVVGSIFGSAQLNNPTTQPQQQQASASIFSNPPAQTSFGSAGNIFGSNNASPNQAGLFGSTAPANKPAVGSESGLFGSKPATSSSGNFFGGSSNMPGPGGGIFGSHPATPTPVFGASIPFGEAAQSQTAAAAPQNAPFRFGATNSTPTPAPAGFGQVAAAAPTFSFGSNPAAAPAPAPALNSQFNFSMGAPSPAFPSAPGNGAAGMPRRYKKAVRRNVPR